MRPLAVSVLLAGSLAHAQVAGPPYGPTADPRSGIYAALPAPYEPLRSRAQLKVAWERARELGKPLFTFVPPPERSDAYLAAMRDLFRSSNYEAFAELACCEVEVAANASVLFDGEIPKACPWGVLFETDGPEPRASLRADVRRIDIECGREREMWRERVSADERARADALDYGELAWFVQGLHRAVAGTWVDLDRRAAQRRQRLDARRLRALADVWDTPWELEPARMLETAPLLRVLAERRPEDRSAILSRIGAAWIGRMRGAGASQYFSGWFGTVRSGPCGCGPMGPTQSQFLRVFSVESPAPPRR